MRLSELVAAGSAGVRLVFGDSSSPVDAEYLTAAGAQLFSDQADTDRVGLLMTNDRATVEVILGALASGSTLVSLPLPGRGADPSIYTHFLREVCKSQQISEIVVADEYAGLLEGTELSLRRHSERSLYPLAAPANSGFHLVQFTSGATGRPRPVLIDDACLGANVAAILRVVQPEPRDAVVSWLPLAHDMGLVGMLLTGISAGGQGWASGGDIVLLDPLTFLRRPALWLEALDHWQGSFTAAPDFGYRLAVQRGRPDGLDLSRVRCAIVGGEIIRAETLTAFTSAYGPQGLEPKALCPAYGLAELGLAATMTPVEENWCSRELSVARLADGEVCDPRRGEAATRLVASGQPLAGYDIASGSLSAGTRPIAVRGPSIGIDGLTGESFANPGGWHTTGDIGFVDDGWLYVCGRSDDYIVARGRNIHAPTLEAAVGESDGIRAGRVTATGLPDGQWVIIAEPTENAPLGPVRADVLHRAIRRVAVEVTATKPDTVVLVAPGTLPFTSSGKQQRSNVRSMYMKDQLIPAEHP